MAPLPLLIDSVETKLSEPWTLDEFRNAYQQYLSGKTEEIDEQRDALRYYHNNSQLNSEQLEWLADHNMEPVVDNQIKMNINTMVGFMERIKGDPKAYPNTEAHQRSADLASLAINTELDEENWDDLYTTGVINGAISGLAGIEMVLEPSRRYKGDMDIKFKDVDPSDYFYDPRTSKNDFSDSGYDGIGKWFGLRQAQDLVPDKADVIASSSGASATQLTKDPDKDEAWYRYNSSGAVDRVRIVECWYKSGNGYRWGVFTGADILYEGEGYFYDNIGRQISKYVMYAASRDNALKAYGFVRDMKPLQDQLNAWMMSLYYNINNHRLILIGDNIQNVEQIRTEWSKPDGTVVIPEGSQVEKDDKRVEISGAMSAIVDSRQQLARFNMDAAAQFEGDPVLSGRAINMLQQAAMARLGPFLKEVKWWKLRVYRYTWAQEQRYWNAERWIAVTGSEDPELTQFIAVNALAIDPQTGQPVIENALGQLDVNIKLDVTKDYVNMEEETFEKLSELAKVVDIPGEALVRSSGLNWKVQQQVLEDMAKAKQPNPIAEAGAKAELENLQADTEKKKADAANAMSTAMSKAQDPLDQAEQMAGIEKTVAETAKISAEAGTSVPTDPLDQLLKMAQVDETQGKAANQWSNAFNNGRSEQTPLDAMEQIAGIRKTEAETDKIDGDASVVMRPDPQPEPAGQQT